MDILQVEFPMNGATHLDARKPRSWMTLAAALVGVLMTFTFPIKRPHQFTNHFRADEVRQSIARHTVLAQRRAGPTERIAQCAVRPALPVEVAIPSKVNFPAHLGFAPDILPLRLLLRLKLCRSSASAQDPLI
jgi:hypothetical protein